MKVLKISREDIRKPTIWEPTGKSPANTPQAVLQTMQMLLQASVNPQTGIDSYEVVQYIIANSPAKNAGNIQISKEQMQLAQQPQPLPGQGVPGGPPPGQGVPQIAGGQPAPGLPMPGAQFGGVQGPGIGLPHLPGLGVPQ